MSFQIVTDSASNLPEEIIDEFGLTVVSLSFYIDNKEYKSYLKGQHTDLQQFYDMMRDGKIVKTSLANPNTMEIAFRNVLDNNNDVLYLGFSSALSSTYQTATVLLDELKEQYPNRTIYSVNTHAASLGEGLLVYLCAQKAQAGASIEEVRDYALETESHICHWFTVDDLMFLMRGGRLTKSAAIAGTMLNIKPVLHVDNEGRLIPVEKCRGRKKAIKSLVKHMKETAINPDHQTVFISHGDCIDDVNLLKELITDEFGITNFVVNYVDPVIGAHSGPGTLALFYLGTKK